MATAAAVPTSATLSGGLKTPSSMATTSSTAATAGSSSTSVDVLPEKPATSRRPVHVRAADPLSDKATILLIRRTLCPQEATKGSGQEASTVPGPSSPPPIQDLLPPLTSRNDVDLQLYALVAIIVREFVLSWYSKISPDEQFVTELVQIVAHLTRALEQRLRRADLARLLLDELPALLDVHVDAYRAAHRPQVALPVVVNARAAYHALCPLPALDGDTPGIGKQAAGEGAGQHGVSGEPESPHEAEYRNLLVGGVLAVLLPTEDLQNGPLIAIVTQILAELLIGGVVARKLAEPWMMWETVGMAARLIREKMDGEEKTAAAKAAADRLKAKLRASGKGRTATIKEDTTAEAAASREKTPGKTTSERDESGTTEESQAGPSEPVSPSTSPSTSPVRLLASLPSPSSWLADTGVPLLLGLLRIGVAVFATLRFLVASIGVARSLPSRLDKKEASSSSAELAASSTDAVPVLAYRVWPAAANLLELDVRMPWLYGSLCMGQWLAMTGPGRIGALDGPLDRLLHHYIHKYALDPALLPGLLRSTRAAVFPGNKFGAPPTLVPPTSEAEWTAVRRRTAVSVVSIVRPTKGAANGGESETEGIVLADVEGALSVLDDAYCNKHLLYGVLEAILVRLLPELAETGVTALFEERLS